MNESARKTAYAFVMCAIADRLTRTDVEHDDPETAREIIKIQAAMALAAGTPPIEDTQKKDAP